MEKTVLIVDDSESIRNILKLTLSFKGYHILEAEDGQKALDTLREKECDLVITDIAMPNMTGLELLDKIRNELENKTLPVIVCTAEKVEQREDILKRGADSILAKPVSPFGLLETVEKLLTA